MSIYQKFCREIFDATGNLEEFQLKFPENFNFGYDVVDVIAKEEPQKTALVWCDTKNQERIFSFGEISAISNQMANTLKKSGIKKGSRVMVILKRHYEYWPLAVALHKLGAVMIPATHMLTVKDFVYRIKTSKADAIVCTPEDQVPEKILQAREEAGIACDLWTVRKEVSSFKRSSLSFAPDFKERQCTVMLSAPVCTAFCTLFSNISTVSSVSPAIKSTLITKSYFCASSNA